MHGMNISKGKAQTGMMSRVGMYEGKADAWRKGQQLQMEIMLRFEGGKEFPSLCGRKCIIFQDLKKINVSE